MRYAYIHGFASGPKSRKGTFLRESYEARGLVFEQPDLNQPSFAELTFTGALAAIDEMVARHPEERWCFIGSSMGGYLSALWSTLHPERLDRLVLLCPAFDLVERWLRALGPDDAGAWERLGSRVFADGTGRSVDLHWEFVADARRWPAAPVTTCPTRIIHGRQDETVPIDGSRDYALANDHVELIEIDDDHQMVSSAPRVLDWSLEWFGVSAH